MTTQQKHPLIGKRFLSFVEKDGQRRVDWQGEVIAGNNIDGFVLQLFEWMNGTKSNQVFVQLSEMKGWEFFDTDEEMRDKYHRCYAH